MGASGISRRWSPGSADAQPALACVGIKDDCSAGADGRATRWVPPAAVTRVGDATQGRSGGRRGLAGGRSGIGTAAIRPHVGQGHDLDRQAAELAARAAALRGAAVNVDKGNAGEIEVGRRLDILDGSGCHVLHDRRKDRRSPANLDHVVIGPAGVLVIDTKNWSGGLLHLDERGMRMGRWRKDDTLQSCKTDAELVERVAREAVPGAHCIGVLAFVQDVGLTRPVLHRGVVMVQQEQLLSWLTRLPRRLDVAQVEALSEHLRAALPARAKRHRNQDGQAPTAHPAPSVPEQWAPPAATTANSTDAGRKARARADARKRLRNGMLKIAVMAAVVLTLPTTMPLAQEHVMEPLAADLTDSFGDASP